MIWRGLRRCCFRVSVAIEDLAEGFKVSEFQGFNDKNNSQAVLGL
jgi:hypothetical protein